MKIDRTKKDGISHLELSGRMTVSSGLGDSLRETFGELLESGERHFVFNLTGIRYVDSAGLGIIVACHKKANDRNGTIELLVEEKSSTRDLLELTHLDKILKVSWIENAALTNR